MAGSTIIARFRLGIPDGKLPPLIDPAAKPTLSLIAFGALAVIAVFVFTPFDLATARPANTCIAPLILLGAGLLAGRYQMARIGLALQGLGLFSLASLVAIFAIVLLCASPAPLADPLLASVDRAVGFDWPVRIDWFRHHAFVLHVAHYVYHTLWWEPGVALVVLAATGQRDRFWIYVTAWAFALLFTTILWGCFPAIGPYPHFSISQSSLPDMQSSGPWLVPNVVLPIHSGAQRQIGDTALMGLVSFPSFHAAGATIVAWALLRTKWLAGPFVALNVAVVASAWPIGGHYLIDLVGGMVVAAVAIFTAIRVQQFAISI